jgi:hypothetical protein
MKLHCKIMEPLFAWVFLLFLRPTLCARHDTFPMEQFDASVLLAGIVINGSDEQLQRPATISSLLSFRLLRWNGSSGVLVPRRHQFEIVSASSRSTSSTGGSSLPWAEIAFSGRTV